MHARNFVRGGYIHLPSVSIPQCHEETLKSNNEIKREKIRKAVCRTICFLRSCSKGLSCGKGNALDVKQCEARRVHRMQGELLSPHCPMQQRRYRPAGASHF